MGPCAVRHPLIVWSPPKLMSSVDLEDSGPPQIPNSWDTQVLHIKWQRSKQCELPPWTENSYRHLVKNPHISGPGQFESVLLKVSCIYKTHTFCCEIFNCWARGRRLERAWGERLTAWVRWFRWGRPRGNVCYSQKVVWGFSRDQNSSACTFYHHVSFPEFQCFT